MLHLIARILLRLGGWTAEAGPPAIPRFVLIAAPHTSNWDFVWVLAFAYYYRLKINWMGKHTLFRPPFGGFMRMLGGIPVHRGERRNVVIEQANALKSAESMCLVVPVEGTRRHVPRWRSGFYHIAREANVPIVMSYLDYSRKRAGFGPMLMPSGDVRRDMDQFRAFYADKVGKFPENGGEVRLAEEDEPVLEAAAGGR